MGPRMLLVLLLLTSVLLAERVDAAQYCGKILTTHVDRICRASRCVEDVKGGSNDVIRKLAAVVS